MRVTALLLAYLSGAHTRQPWRYTQNTYQVLAYGDCDSCCGASAKEACGPSNWHQVPVAEHRCRLDTTFCMERSKVGLGQRNTCNITGQQSPVALFSDTPVNSSLRLLRIETPLACNRASFRVSHQGHEVECSSTCLPQKGVKPHRYSSIRWHGRGTYYLRSIRFRAPSEHTVDGRWCDAEAQHLFQDEHGERLLMVAVCLVTKDSSQPNPWLAALFRAQPGFAALDEQDFLVDPVGFDFIQQRSAYYTYTGSLTTPPCDLLVEWIVMDTPSYITREQEEQLTSWQRGVNHTQFTSLGNTARPRQPLGTRVVYMFEPDDDVSPDFRLTAVVLLTSVSVVLLLCFALVSTAVGILFRRGAGRTEYARLPAERGNIERQDVVETDATVEMESFDTGQEGGGVALALDTERAG